MTDQELSLVPTAEEIATQFEPLTCERCMKGDLLPFQFSFAFQPIVDISTRSIHSYEALVRGAHGEDAQSVLSQVTRKNRFRFDQLCRAKAISLATHLNISTFLNINFLVNAVYNPDQCIQVTLECARKNRFPTDRIIFETTEEEKIEEPTFLRSVLDGYRKHGLRIAIVDAGEEVSDSNFLAQIRPDYLKIDRRLITGIDSDSHRNQTVSSLVQRSRSLEIKVIADGVETLEEARILREMGVTLFQGYFFARPTFESLPPVANLNF